MFRPPLSALFSDVPTNFACAFDVLRVDAAAVVAVIAVIGDVVVVIAVARLQQNNNQFPCWIRFVCHRNDMPLQSTVGHSIITTTYIFSIHTASSYNISVIFLLNISLHFLPVISAVLGSMRHIHKRQPARRGLVEAHRAIDGPRQFAGVHDHCLGAEKCAHRLSGHVGGVGRRTHRQFADANVQRGAVVVARDQISRASHLQK